MSHNAIDRFHLPEDTGYSEYWRRNKSPVEVFELARLLLALRKVASYVGRNVGAIVWSGMKAENALVIDPAMVVGSYPVPAEKTDRVTGLTIRLAYGKIEWSERLKELALLEVKLPPRHGAQFQFYIDMCEKVYLDCLSNRSALGFYTRVHRLWAIQRALDGASHPPTISELMHLWWKSAADRTGGKYGEGLDDCSRSSSEGLDSEEYYKEPMALLNSMVGDLVNKCPLLPTLTERGDHRLKLYLSVWRYLFKHIERWPIGSNDPGVGARKERRKTADFEDELIEEEPASLLVLPELMEKATRNIPVFTEDVKRVVRNHEEVVAVEGNDILMQARDRVNRRVMHHLSIIIRAAAQRKAAVSRGLKAGKVDRSRLYRANITGTIFKLVKTDFELKSDMIVLVDSSGSMSAIHHWENVETVYQTLFTAIHAFSSKAKLIAYNEIRDKCLLTDIFHGGCFYNVLRHGKTASGEAIIATALSLKGSQRKSYILHITDGASNWGCGVTDATALCRREGINLLTLGIGCNENSRKSLRKEYGRLVQFIDRIEDLPHLLRDLLNYSQWS